MIKGRSQFKLILSDFRSWAHPLSRVSGLLRVSPYLRVREGTLSSREMTLKEVSAIVWVPQSRCDFGHTICISASLSVAVFIYEDSLVAHTPWTIQDVSTFKSQIHDPNPTRNSLFYDHWKARGKWATGTAGTSGPIIPRWTQVLSMCSSVPLPVSFISNWKEVTWAQDSFSGSRLNFQRKQKVSPCLCISFRRKKTFSRSALHFHWRGLGHMSISKPITGKMHRLA